MKKLKVPKRLKKEFATVEAVLNTKSTTPNLDGLILCWVKYEKQLRKIFTFLVYQTRQLSTENWRTVEERIIANRNLYPESIIREIGSLDNRPVFKELCDQNAALFADVLEIGKNRNKLLHGQITGKRLKAGDLRRQCQQMIDWVNLTAKAAGKSYGYDGLKRNSLKHAWSGDRPNRQFADLNALLAWIDTIKK